LAGGEAWKARICDARPLEHEWMQRAGVAAKIIDGQISLSCRHLIQGPEAPHSHPCSCSREVMPGTYRDPYLTGFLRCLQPVPPAGQKLSSPGDVRCLQARVQERARKSQSGPQGVLWAFSSVPTTSLEEGHFKGSTKSLSVSVVPGFKPQQSRVQDEHGMSAMLHHVITENPASLLIAGRGTWLPSSSLQSTRHPVDGGRAGRATSGLLGRCAEKAVRLIQRTTVFRACI
jgi:hypothetical protein